MSITKVMIETDRNFKANLRPERFFLNNALIRGGVAKSNTIKMKKPISVARAKTENISIVESPRPNA